MHLFRNLSSEQWFKINLTQICLSDGGLEGWNGVVDAREKAFTREIGKPYQKAEEKKKTEILNELVKTTGYDRKYVLHILVNWGKTVTGILNSENLRLMTSQSKLRQEA